MRKICVIFACLCIVCSFLSSTDLPECTLSSKDRE